jgi:voltage-gated potassium channel
MAIQRLSPVGRLRDLWRALRQEPVHYWLALRHEHIPQLAGASLALLFIGAATVHLIERAADDAIITSFGEALWYGIVTMTGTGYGDFTPKTPAGRLIGTALMLGGMTVLTLFTATFASILVTSRIREGRGLETISYRGHILVCGWNQYGERVVQGLLAADRVQAHIVLVNELSEEAAGEIISRLGGDSTVRYVRGDPAHEAVLERANVRQASAAVVLADASRGLAAASDERTTLVTLTLKSLRPDLKVTAEALDYGSEAHLRRAGADDIVISGEFNGFLLSRAATSPGLADVVRRLLSVGGTELRRHPVPPELVGRTFGELFTALRARTGFLTIAVITENKDLTLDDLLTDDYSLVDEFIKQQFSEAGTEYLRFEAGGLRVLVNPPDTYVVHKDDTAVGIPRQDGRA